jgi:GDP-4-dehydro-6-deoxy-D-mannose reductase
LRSLLVTGASGFVGRHFVAAAAAQGFAIDAIGRTTAPEWLPSNARWIVADLSDPSSFAAISREYWGVAHFANFSIPAEYENDDVVAGSLAMTVRLIAHLESARFLFSSSCHVYAAGQGMKVEDSVVAPAGRYGRAKVEAEQHVLSAAHLDSRVARPFNHIGRHMHPGLMLPSLVARVKAAKPGAAIVMRGKNSVRDFLDVRDIVNAYLAILELDNPEHRIINVCSGIPTSIGELAERFVKIAGKNNAVVFEEQAQSADDIDELVGDSARLLRTGWRRRCSLDDSIIRILSEKP